MNFGRAIILTRKNFGKVKFGVRNGGHVERSRIVYNDFYDHVISTLINKM